MLNHAAGAEDRDPQQYQARSTEDLEGLATALLIELPGQERQSRAHAAPNWTVIPKSA